GVGTLEIKVRGIDIDPAALRRRLKPTGRNAATLILTPTPHGARALVARRV
ncbi:MAG: SAM-dependent methyltransferase, partial [Propionicimonas sp.]|nr:SAM-dependent methyltransferase [Propionicimonas sp.]